ncbi:MAG: HNH endonuclease [Synergistaceae bacterium]|nr:HNH endonuclease [Synergistaceae bacterium]
MIKWYTVKDIMVGYSLEKWQITNMCKEGKLGAMRVRDERFKKSPGQYLIPEAELVKLSEYKTGEPLFKEAHQPSEYLTWKNHETETERMEELIGNYREYLRSERWLSLRNQALKRDGFVCQMCGSGINLRVHHVHYEHVGTEYEIDDLVTLCEECHSKVHAKDNHRLEVEHETARR